MYRYRVDAHDLKVVKVPEAYVECSVCGHCSRCDAFHMVVKAGTRVYLTADEVQVIKKALDAYFDHCGEVIADYKESETLEMEHTAFETENYNEAHHERDVIRLSLWGKIK